MKHSQQGKPLANVAAMRGMLTQSSTVELSADVTAGELCTLCHMDPRRETPVLCDNARNE